VFKWGFSLAAKMGFVDSVMETVAQWGMKFMMEVEMELGGHRCDDDNDGGMRGALLYPVS
jgi:hypothetical protein